MARERGLRAGDGPGLSSHPLPSMPPPDRQTHGPALTLTQRSPPGPPGDEAGARLFGAEQKAPVEERGLGWDTGGPGSSRGSVTNSLHDLSKSFLSPPGPPSPDPR